MVIYMVLTLTLCVIDSWTFQDPDPYLIKKIKKIIRLLLAHDVFFMRELWMSGFVVTVGSSPKVVKPTNARRPASQLRPNVPYIVFYGIRYLLGIHVRPKRGLPFFTEVARETAVCVAGTSRNLRGSSAEPSLFCEEVARDWLFLKKRACAEPSGTFDGTFRFLRKSRAKRPFMVRTRTSNYIIN